MWAFPFVLSRTARTSCNNFKPGHEFQLVEDWDGNPVNQKYQDAKGRILITGSNSFKIKSLNFQPMAKSNAKKLDAQFASINQSLPTAAIDLGAICANIWYKYFNDKSLTKSDKEVLRNKYNEAARAYNKIRPGTIVLMSDNPKWKPSTPEEGKYVPPSNEHLMQHQAETVDMWLGRIVIDGADNMPDFDDEDVPLPKAKPKDLHVEKLTTPRAAASSAPKGGSTIAQIIALYESGVSKKDIIEQHGFNKNTVNRQVGEYIKRQQSK